jgi:hypothetical protein
MRYQISGTVMPILNLAEEITRCMPGQHQAQPATNVGGNIAAGAIGGILGGLLGGGSRDGI